MSTIAAINLQLTEKEISLVIINNEIHSNENSIERLNAKRVKLLCSLNAVDERLKDYKRRQTELKNCAYNLQCLQISNYKVKQQYAPQPYTQKSYGCC